MTIKIDLKKAYDHLSWAFIGDTLDLLGLPPSWVRNGKKLKSFKPSRGIRQGDVISLYIFVLCMERLGH